MAEYTYKQWGDEKTEENNIHADDCYRWQAGIEAAGGTWDGEWVDLDKTGKGLITADQLNALEQEIADLYGSGFTAKTFEDSNIPGTAEWNRIEDAINTILSRTAFAIYCETDNSLTFYVDAEVPEAGDTYDGKVVANVYTGFDKVTWTSTTSPYWIDIVDVIESVTIDKSFSVCRPVSLAYWFYNFANITTVSGAGNIDTSSVTTLRSTFNDCSSMTSVDVSNWDTSNVTTMYSMFNTCSSLTTLDVSNWDTSKVTTMYNMFRWCYELTEIDVSSWDTSKVTNMYSMFARCYAVTELDVSNFDTSNVTNMEYMFYMCSALATIYSDDSKFVTTAVTSSGSMFTDCTSLVGGSGTKYDSSKVTASMAHIDTADNPGYFTAKG